MAQESVDTERTSVKTYIPVYQREEWERHAEKLDMSRSEFIRTMVQAGRQSFEGTAVAPSRSATDDSQSSTEGTSTPELSTDGELDERVLEILSTTGPHSWEELLETLTDDVEERLDAALQRLQAENAVQYSGREGGYTLLEDHGD